MNYFSLPTGSRKISLYLLIFTAIYANSPQDLLMCTDGFGALDSKNIMKFIFIYSSNSWSCRCQKLPERSLSLRQTN